MPTLRQATVASVMRRYPLYSGCGTLANHSQIRRLAGPGSEIAWPNVPGGYRVGAPLDDYVGRAAYYTGDLDRKVTWILKRLLKPGDRVLDIGANIGLVTFTMAGLVGPRGSVDAFEPIPAMQALIADGIERNECSHFVTLHRCALGAETDTLYLSVPRENAGSATLVPGRAQGDIVSVPVRRLDDLDIAGPVKLIKLDVEGYEPEVISGGMGFIERARPAVILFETNDGDDRATTMLVEQGYRILGIPKRYVRMRLTSGVEGNDKLAVRADQYERVADLMRVRER